MIPWRFTYLCWNIPYFRQPIYFSLPLEICGFSQHTDFCGLPFAGPVHLRTSMPNKITDLTVHDIRFPTSRTLDGSDAMNPAPDYSAAYVILRTNDPSELCGHGFAFTIGRGTELCVAAIDLLAGHVVGHTLEDIAADMAG